MSANIRRILVSAVVAGAFVAATGADAAKRHWNAGRNVVGVWHCAVAYSDLIAPNPFSNFSAALMFNADRNVAVIANKDDSGLIASPPEIADLTGMSTAAYGRWQPKSHRKVAFSAIFFEANGLAAGAAAGLPKDTTKLRCEVAPGHKTMTGECKADIFAPNGDPISDDPLMVYFPDEPLFTAECKRLGVD